MSLHPAKNDETSSVLPLPNTSAHQAIEVGTTTVESVALSSLLGQYPNVDLVKIDIEGAECSAIRDLGDADLARIAQISVEFHGHRRFGFEIGHRARAAIREMVSRGFIALDFEPQHQNTLFLNRRVIEPSLAEIAVWRVRAAIARSAYWGDRVRGRLWRLAKRKLRR